MVATATKTRKRAKGTEQGAASDPVRSGAKALQNGRNRKEVASAPVDPLAVNSNEVPKKERKPRKAKADAAKESPVAAPHSAALDIPVSYGGVSIGKETARLGLTIDRKVLNIVAANDAFCNRRLHGRVLLGDDDGTLFEKSLEVAGVFDVKGFRATSDAIGVGLTFQMNEIDIASLAKFSKGGGRLVVDEIAPGAGGSSEFDEDEE